MQGLSKFLVPSVLAMIWLTAAPFSAAAETGKVNWNPPPKLSLKALGQVKIGMTVKEVKALFNKVTVIDHSDGQECFYLEPQGVPQGAAFMITDGRVSRIDIDSTQYASLSGAKIGQTEQQVMKLYTNQLKVSRHHYDEKGHYLTFVPKDSRDKNYRMVFETDGRKITTFRAGKLPEVEFVEGCL